MRRKLLFGLLVLILLVLPCLAACTTPAPAPAPEEPAAPAPGPPGPPGGPGGGPPPMEPITSPAAGSGAPEIRFSAFMPPFAVQVGVYKEWVAKLAEASDGEINITIYPGSTLLAEDDAVSGVMRGIADIADVHPQRYPGGHPLTEILSLPFLPLGSAESGLNIWMAIEEKFPEVKAETSDIKVLFRTNTAGYALHTKKEVRAPEDLEGVKIMASTELAEVMDSIGAAPMSLIVTEWYLSLDRGLVDAMWMNWGGFYDMKCWEFLDHHTLYPSGVSMGMVEIIMNMDTWNSLSPKSQKAFDDLSLWATERVRQLEEIDKANTAIEDLKSKGQNFVTLTPAEEKVWFEAAQPVIESFIAKGEAQGLPSRAVYEEVMRLAGQ